MHLIACRNLLRKKEMRKTLLMMKLTAIFLLALCLNVSAKGFSQNISLSMENVSLEKVFKEIKRQTGYTFAYTKSLLQKAKQVTINISNAPIEKALDVCFHDQPIAYTIINKTVVIVNKKEAPAEKEQVSTPPPPIDVSGKVTNQKGEPLNGASITEKGTSNTTVTKEDGTFTITVSRPNAVLVITFIGYEKSEITVGSQTEFSIVMKTSPLAMNEVVVIGYGNQRSRDVSGSVSTVSTKQIASNPAPNLTNSLMGRTAGIIATQRAGEPGNDASNIFIRGVGTTGDASPVFVIDGIVRYSSDFAQLNPNEIQSVSILKDAASAAVFGVRGGNGVILITTKRGSAGKMQITYNANFGIQTRTRTIEFLNSYDYATLYNEALANEGKAPLYSQADLQKYKDQSDPDAYPSSDWNSIMNKNPMITQHDLSASGGSDKIRYATSFSYLNQDGIVPSNNFKRYNFRSNIDADVTRSTVLSFDLAGRSEATNNIVPTNIWQLIASTTPTKFPVRFSNGFYAGGPSYNVLPDNGYRKKKTGAFRGRLQLVQRIPFIEGLSVKAVGSFDKTLIDSKTWFYPVIPFYTRLPDGTFRKEPLPKSSLSQDHFDDQSITLETHINYEKRFGSNRITGLLLYTQTKQVWNDLNGYRENYAINIDEINFGPSANRNNGGYSGASGRRGVVGRINFSHSDKYTLETSFRADGSEQFAKGKRWGFFPSVSGSYVISQESFMKNITFLNFLKLRTSYGILGNDRIGAARFLYLQSYNPSGSAVFGNGDVQQAIVEGSLANPDVTWETVKKLDVGFDASFFSGKLTTTFDYFYDKRSDILGRRNASVPALLGVGLPVENFTKVDNRGIELTIGHQNAVSKNLRYTISGNVTYARNKVVFIDEPATTNPNLMRTGRPLGTEFGFQAIGLFQTQDEVDKAPTQIGNNRPGDIRYKDVNNDGKIDDNDRVPIGKANTPEIVYGFNGGLNFKNFELSFLLQGATNVNQWYRGEGIWPFFVGAGALKTNLDRWTPSNPNASEPRVLISIDNMNHHDLSSFWLKNSSYLKLRNVELAFNLPKALLEKTKAIQGLRFYVNCNNVYTWTKIKNFDPENGSDRGWAYPQLRIFNTGFNIQF